MNRPEHLRPFVKYHERVFYDTEALEQLHQRSKRAAEERETLIQLEFQAYRRCVAPYICVQGLYWGQILSDLNHYTLQCHNKLKSSRYVQLAHYPIMLRFRLCSGDPSSFILRHLDAPAGDRTLPGPARCCTKPTRNKDDACPKLHRPYEATATV